MRAITAETFAGPSMVRRVLHQQGVGGRAKALRNRMIRRAVGLLLLAMVLSIVHVWSRMKVLELRYAMTSLQKQTTELQQRINRTELVVAALKAPERLERVAKEELGMQLPAVGQVVFVQESSHGAEGNAADSEPIGRPVAAGQ